MILLEDCYHPVLGEPLGEFIECDHRDVELGVEVREFEAYLLHIRVEDVYAGEVSGCLQVLPELLEGERVWEESGDGVVHEYYEGDVVHADEGGAEAETLPEPAPGLNLAPEYERRFLTQSWSP